MLRSISSRQFLDWMYYDEIDPFGSWREDYRQAEVVTAIYNVNRNPKKRSEPFKTTDFLVRFGRRTEQELKPKQTWQHQLSIAHLYLAASKKKVS
jgi:hypothetical protein